jgi:hypothetical protein
MAAATKPPEVGDHADEAQQPHRPPGEAEYQHGVESGHAGLTRV